VSKSVCVWSVRSVGLRATARHQRCASMHHLLVYFKHNHSLGTARTTLLHHVGVFVRMYGSGTWTVEAGIEWRLQ